MPYIKNRTPCTNEEITELQHYLKGTPVFNLTNYFEKNHTLVYKGVIESNIDLGKTKTIWSNLGGVLSKSEYSSDKFLVKQVCSTLKNPNCKDKGTLVKIKEYTQLLVNKKLEMKVTLLETNNQLIICDGNKRAVAWFEYFLKCKSTNIRLPVFIISTFET